MVLFDGGGEGKNAETSNLLGLDPLDAEQLVGIDAPLFTAFGKEIFVVVPPLKPFSRLDFLENTSEIDHYFCTSLLCGQSIHRFGDLFLLWNSDTGGKVVLEREWTGQNQGKRCRVREALFPRGDSVSVRLSTFGPGISCVGARRLGVDLDRIAKGGADPIHFSRIEAIRLGEPPFLEEGEELIVLLG
jgi:hypothetical protein